MIEPVDHCAVIALARERADMSFDQHAFLPRPTSPFARAPFERIVVDHFTRTEYIFRLEAGCRIRHVNLIIDAEFVARTGFRTADISNEPAVVPALHRQWPRLQDEIDVSSGGRPQAERGAVACHPRAECRARHIA